MALVPVATYLPNAFRGIQTQVRNLGDDLTEAELAAYMQGNGSVSAQFIPDRGAVTNPLRTKACHMARVKFFCMLYTAGQHVDPVKVSASRFLFGQYVGPYCDDGTAWSPLTSRA